MDLRADGALLADVRCRPLTARSWGVSMPSAGCAPSSSTQLLARGTANRPLERLGLSPGILAHGVVDERLVAPPPPAACTRGDGRGSLRRPFHRTAAGRSPPSSWRSRERTAPAACPGDAPPPPRRQPGAVV